MSQNVNLSFSGIYNSVSDYNGLPPGSVKSASNVVSRYKNLFEPRRGFEFLEGSDIPGETISRMTNFLISEIDRTLVLTSAGILKYYNGAGYTQVSGDYSTGIVAPDARNGKSRFIKAGQNVYVTSQDGVRSLSNGTSAQSLRAGIPKALNLEATIDDSIFSGFFINNIVLTTTGTIVTGGADITDLGETTGIAENQYISIDVVATLVLQDLTYTSQLFGDLGNAITVTYTAGGTAGSEGVTVVDSAITVQIETGVSTANQVLAAIFSSADALALVSVVVSGTGTNAQTTGTGTLTGGSAATIPDGTRVLSITDPATVIVETATVTAGSASITTLVSNAGIVAGLIVSGIGIPDGARVDSISGAGPYTVVLTASAFQTGTLVEITFTSPATVTMDQNALVSLTGATVRFYTGSQVAYKILYGRVETNASDGTITRVGAASPRAIATNTTPYSVNTTVTATLPKNSENLITFAQLYRSVQTVSVDVSPIDEYQLVSERQLVSADFINRTITIADSTPVLLRGASLYSGSDRETILQSNDPPPMCYDMCTFRDFAVYVNITQPSTLKFTIVSVGPSDGVQIGDEITIYGSVLETAFTQTYTGAATEDATSREFEIFTAGTPSQNITDTTNSLIRVINYDNDLPIHALLLSSSTNLPGQILLEADNPTFEKFTVTANLHQEAYDPTLSTVSSTIGTVRNGISISKSGELEAVPATNLYYAGDDSSPIYRCIALRDYVIIIKSDGIYKLQGLTPPTLLCSSFDLTTQVIGADTAVKLNSSVWMFSNQGVVKISDGGVDAQSSLQVDNELNVFINSYFESVNDVSFAMGYESEREYILSLPNSNDSVTVIQYVFNYVTNTWTTWDRRLRCAHIHSEDEVLYIGRGDPDNDGISRERKTETYADYIDESIFGVTITAVSGLVLTLSDVSEIEVGDVIIEGDNYSLVTAVTPALSQVTVEFDLSWTIGAIEIGTSYLCQVAFKQVFGDNPAFVRQFQEGLILFKDSSFYQATLNFDTDYDSGAVPVTLYSVFSGAWGLFAWGEVPWGGEILPASIRFLVPQEKQLGSYIIPTLSIKQGYSNFKCQGMSMSYNNVSQEVGQ